MAPVVVVPAFAGALLGGRFVVATIAAGAVAGPIGAIVAIAGSCDSNMFAAIGLAAAAAYALLIAGLAAFAGERMGGSDWIERNRGRGLRILVVVGAIGVIGWIPAVATFGGCR